LVTFPKVLFQFYYAQFCYVMYYMLHTMLKYKEK